MEKLLQRPYEKEHDARALTRMRQRQMYYNKNAKPLRLIARGKTARMRLPGKAKWSARTCRKKWMTEAIFDESWRGGIPQKAEASYNAMKIL